MLCDSRGKMNPVSGAAVNAEVTPILPSCAGVDDQGSTKLKKIAAQRRRDSSGVIGASPCGKNPLADWRKQTTCRRKKRLSRVSPLAGRFPPFCRQWKRGLWSNMQPAIVERALEVSRKRRGYLDAMRKAICAGDKDSVFELAKKLTGLSDEECHRTDSRFN